MRDNKDVNKGLLQELLLMGVKLLSIDFYKEVLDTLLDTLLLLHLKDSKKQAFLDAIDQACESLLDKFTELFNIDLLKQFLFMSKVDDLVSIHPKNKALTIDGVKRFLRINRLTQRLQGRRDSNINNTRRALKKVVRKAINNGYPEKAFKDLVSRQIETRKMQTLSTLRDITSESRLQFRGEHASKLVKVWLNTGVFDAFQTDLCRSFKFARWEKFSDIKKKEMTPRHPRCRSKIIPSRVEKDFDITVKKWNKWIKNAHTDDLTRHLSDNDLLEYRTLLREWYGIAGTSLEINKDIDTLEKHLKRL